MSQDAMTISMAKATLKPEKKQAACEGFCIAFPLPVNKLTYGA
jgi:hypothetical protein